MAKPEAQELPVCMSYWDVEEGILQVEGQCPGSIYHGSEVGGWSFHTEVW